MVPGWRIGPGTAVASLPVDKASRGMDEDQSTAMNRLLSSHCHATWVGKLPSGS